MRALLEEEKTMLCSIEEDAWDVMVALTGSEELELVKEKYKNDEGRMNMCQALKEMLMDERYEGKMEGKSEGKLEEKLETAYHLFEFGMPEESIAKICNLELDKVNDLFETWNNRNIF